MINCSSCPCLNSDYEDGSHCNLGFSTDLSWFDKKTGEHVRDTPEMRSHQDDYMLFYASSNCTLRKIITDDTTYVPQPVKKFLAHLLECAEKELNKGDSHA